MTGVEHAGDQFIAGQWVGSTSPDRLPVTNPSTGALIDAVCKGSAEDADAAVAAARAALAEWSGFPVLERIEVLRRTATILEEKVEDLASRITDEVGTPLSLSRDVQVRRPIQVLRALCDAGIRMSWTEQLGNTLVTHEPLGVVVAITPWNFPLHQTLAKVGAALVAGCTVVLKPSEVAPFSSYALADALVEAGLPAGAFNVVTGTGQIVGEQLVTHPGVDGITFTGSTAVGRHIAAAAAGTIKRVALELGGKGPSVVLPGADVAAAAKATAARCFTNSGQVCAALSRLIVPRAELAEAEQALQEFVAAQTVGDPRDPGTTMGPLVSSAHKDLVLSYLEQGVAEGARAVAGDPYRVDDGNFVAPVVFSDVTPEMTIAQEEIFGPVLSVLAYDDVDEAVEIANNSQYGLVGAVWGPDDDGAAEIANRLRVGMVGINGGRINVDAPFGGYRQSGVGREFGTFGIMEFLETKSLNFSGSEAIRRPAGLP
ncbi:aldehyde dehydrogenase family protein [Nocardia jiangxiensis]|uniref:aldehyde dehydrogenase family protein n=1 Tax=Nocardia jiangxiensis TaxID=282685 RepID=UPI00030EA693|nr:aldehyde dehydrogenase family protein [Nocardia jiangxiensis]